MANRFEREIQELRKKAEIRLKNRPSSSENNEESNNVEDSFDELQIYRTELEIQHEELQRANRELHELYDEYWELYEFAPCGYVTLNAKGIITRINQAAIDLLGLAVKTPITYLGFSRLIIPEHQGLFFTTLQVAKQTQQKQSLELQLVNANLWVHLDIEAIVEDTGTIKQWRLALTDVTAEKEAETERLRLSRLQAFQEQAQRERLLNAITQRIRESLELKEIAEQTVRQLLDVFPVTRAILAIYDQQGEAFDLVRIATASDTGIDIASPVNVCNYSEVQEQFQDNRLLAIDDVQAERARNPILERVPEARSLLAAKISYQNRLQGVISLQTWHECYQWQKNEKQLLKQISDQLAIALQQARLYQQLQTELAEQNRLQQQLLYEAIHDKLTGLPNRNLLVNRLGKAIQRYQRQAEAFFAVLFLDLNGFKSVNDTFGHSVGDCLLVNISQRLSHTLREEDTIARFGGDEFIILLENLTDQQGAIEVANRLHQALTPPVFVNGHQLEIGTSIGIVFYHSGYSDSDAMLRDADIAMYRSKNSGARYVIFDDQA